MKYNNYFLALAGLLATSAHAQSHPEPAGVPPCVAYTGNVVGNGKPLTGVSVAVEGTNIIIITNEEGFFALPARIRDAPTVAVSGAGFEPQKLTYPSCAPLLVDMVMLPGARIKKHGKRKGYIMKDGLAREKRFR